MKRNYGIQDNLFLDRYAESVSRNGREIPANMTGIWAVKNEDINQLLKISSGTLSNTCIWLVEISYWLKFAIIWKHYQATTRKRRAESKPLTSDVIVNIQDFCAGKFDFFLIFAKFYFQWNQKIWTGQILFLINRKPILVCRP